jgi:hypothetical protein
VPYTQQKFVSIVSHDDATWDVYVNFRANAAATSQTRYSVLVAKSVTRDSVVSAAVGLAVYVRLTTRSESIFVRKDHIYNGIRFDALRAERVALEARRTAVPHRPVVREMSENAEVRSLSLLRQIDPDLAEKMTNSRAFYFTTPSFRYIWYPSVRAIISLDDDAPKYVCVHSTDPAVERNKYDWALTMRTYLLANEQHWRAKANFHPEFGLRCSKESFEQKTGETASQPAAATSAAPNWSWQREE